MPSLQSSPASAGIVGVGVLVRVLVATPVGVVVGVSVTVGVDVGVRVGVRVAVSVGVLVGVRVGVSVGVLVGVRVGVLVEVCVGVLVRVVVGVRVGVVVRVGLGSTHWSLLLQTPPSMKTGEHPVPQTSLHALWSATPPEQLPSLGHPDVHSQQPAADEMRGKTAPSASVKVAIRRPRRNRLSPLRGSTNRDVWIDCIRRRCRSGGP